MEVLWRRRNATVKEVHAELNRERKLAYTTVATLLTRLQERGYVSAQERGRAYVFRPLVARDKVIQRKVSDLVSRVLGGNLAPLAAYIAENRDLTPEQIAVLEGIARSERDKEGC